MLLTLANAADKVGLRPLVAAAASLAYSGRKFSTDGNGNWVNKQPECTIVSPILHTADFATIEREVLDNWARAYVPKRGDVVIDVGAGVGEEAVVFGRRGAEVISIEAHPRTFRCLEQTIARSGLSNVKPLHLALGAADGTMSISDSTSDHIQNTVLFGGNVSIPVRSLDSLVKQFGLERIDFLRLNIEGAERMAIEGMAESIALVRNVSISCHDFIADLGHGEEYRSLDAVIPFLERSCFTVTRRAPEAGRPWVAGYVYGSRD